MNIPDYAIERLARAMLPLIQKYYESEEGQKELKSILSVLVNVNAYILEKIICLFVDLLN